MEAYRKEYQGFNFRDAVRMVLPPRGPGAKPEVLGSTTRVDYKVKQGVLQKRNFCVHEGISKVMVLTTAILRDQRRQKSD